MQVIDELSHPEEAPKEEKVETKEETLEVNQSLYDTRQGSGLGADDGVDGVGYDFRVHHIKQGYESRKEHAEGKVALGTREEMQY